MTKKLLAFLLLPSLAFGQANPSCSIGTTATPIALRWEAFNIAICDGSTPTSTWPDSSGANNYGSAGAIFEESTAVCSPSIVNGNAAVYFNSYSSYLPQTGLYNSLGQTLFAVIVPTEASGSSSYWISSGDAGAFSFFENCASEMHEGAASTGLAFYGCGSSAYSLNRPIEIDAEWQSAGSSVTFGSGFAFDSSLTISPLPTSAITDFFSSGTAISPFHGYVAALVVANGPMNSSDVLAVRSYLNCEYFTPYTAHKVFAVSGD